MIQLFRFTVQQVILGILHVMCLGVTAYVLRNVLWDGIHQEDGRCALLWKKLRAYYTANYIKYQFCRTIH